MTDAERPSANAPAGEYYSTHGNAALNRTRTFSTTERPEMRQAVLESAPETRYRRRRRGSHDEKASKPRRFLIDVDETANLILAQEDTDGDFQITVNDAGPKVLKVGTADSGGFHKFDVRGTYMLSNLLQELALAKDYGRKHIVIDESRLNENPVDRLSRMIKYHFWDGLTRRIDADGLEIICADPKNLGADHTPRIYIPYNDDIAYNYYAAIVEARPHLNLQLIRLPEDITPTYVKSINDRPGILSLDIRTHVDETGRTHLEPVSFVVPGGRFNEMYGWDSYFEALALIIDGRLDLARNMVDNFIYSIRHYGKILNANRSYYLTRSQPPFLTDMALKVFERLPAEDGPANAAWLHKALTAAIKEYYTVWMVKPRLDDRTGLSCFHPTGIGMPPETESTHFDHILEPFANAMNVSIDEYKVLYNTGKVQEPKLDRYFVHDRAVRESGHDTTYRLEKRCADLATVDLNALLYKYEIDIAESIRDVFDDTFTLADGTVETSHIWFERATRRREALDRYCWNEEKGLYFDYDVRLRQMIDYESVTTFYTMWAGCASERKAQRMLEQALPKFEVIGGLVCGTEESRGVISLDRPNRQWDYPFGWAPHQIMGWEAMRRYNYNDVASRLAYRWLYTITKSFVDFNGVVPEKFDVVNLTHQVKVEYGNVGTDFKFVTREGFGWMNASYQVGLQYITSHMRRALGTLTSPQTFFTRVPSPPASRGEPAKFSLEGVAPAAPVRIPGAVSPAAGADRPVLSITPPTVDDMRAAAGSVEIDSLVSPTTAGLTPEQRAHLRAASVPAPESFITTVTPRRNPIMSPGLTAANLPQEQQHHSRG
ncbi:alpha,alpha-trehalase nth1 [Tieghemiomyces parasiticus]|uniref:Trehalase n=1 Tax=Tieghemiomyces parasiticus TaxID=78921 RepID=A0A9W8DS78_9FUNG|nr:alpha,alpha-trehalase nth1 [Tieghemiomyces parasiticus]